MSTWPTRLLSRRQASLRSARGFTLIELLIVIGIIMLLASILIVAVFPLVARAKIVEGSKRLQILDEGLSRWSTKNSGMQMPVKVDFPAGGGYTPATMTDGEFLRFLLFPSETEITAYWRPMYNVEESVFDKQEVAHMLNDDHSAFVDPWQGEYHYRFPGSDHSTTGGSHLDESGNITQANHLVGGKPDIWSDGPNGVNDEANWGTQNNLTTDNDDITNWFVYD